MISVLKRRLAPVPVADGDRLPSKVVDNARLLPVVVELIHEGHTVTLPLRGNSMRPFLCHKRDKALLTAVPERLSVGLPVLAEVAPGHYVLHRIVGINGNHITLLGDGNVKPEHCLRQNVVALATAFYRKGRTRPDSITSLKWRAYSALWMRLRPVRRQLLMLHHLLFRSLKVLDD